MTSKAGEGRAVTLTDPRLITVPAFLILTTLLLIDQMAAFGALGVTDSVKTPAAARAASAVVLAATLFVLLAVGRASWLRTRLAARHPAVLVATVFVGTVFGVVATTVMLGMVGVTGVRVDVDQFVFLPATTLIVLIAAGEFRAHRKAVATHEAGVARLRQAFTQGKDAIQVQRDGLRQAVRELLEQRLGPTLLRPSLFTKETLKQISDGVVRPLSHQLAAQHPAFRLPAVHARPRTTFVSALRALNPRLQVKPLLLAAVMLFLTFRYSVREATPPEPAAGVGVSADWTSFFQSLAEHAATFFVVWVAMLLARRINQKTAGLTVALHSTVTFGAVVTCGVGAFFALRLINVTDLLGGLPETSSLVVTGFVLPLVLVTVTDSVATTARQALYERENAAARQNRELAEAVARINALLLHEQHLFARHLHASVQASVNAASLLIAKAHTEGTDTEHDVYERAAELLDDAFTSLFRLLPDDTSSQLSAQSMAKLLANVTATWAGVAEVTVTSQAPLTEFLVDDPVARLTVTDLVAEACANAVVHGDAQTIAIAFASDARGDITVTVRDNGTLSASPRRDGMGTRTLQRLCTSWTLDTVDGHTVLTAVLPGKLTELSVGSV